ncbi:hypothetical protein C2E23DRAFT_728910, partial [Lenzites betulinus]
MPKPVIQRLSKLTRKYLWNDKHSPPVHFAQLLLPVEAGGLGLLDLTTRNDTIDVVWLKEYLNFSEERPMWAYVADDLFARNTPAQCSPADPELRINMFLQHWRPLRKGLPKELLAIIDTAKNTGLRLEGRAFTRDILRAMPMWDHAQAEKTLIRRLGSRSAATACLKDVHRLRTVGDFEALEAEVSDPAHSRLGGCRCDRCTYLTSELGCTDPQRCYERATQFLDALPPKWDPRGEHPCDYEDAAHTAAAELFPSDDGTPVIFDRRVTTDGTLTNAFRVFEPSPSVPGTLPDMATHDGHPLEAVATDGSCTNNGHRDARAGAGVFFAPHSARNRSVHLPESLDQTNQAGEAVASLLASRWGSPSAPL